MLLLVHESVVRTPTGRRQARLAKLLGPVPLVGLAAVPLGAVALVLGRGGPAAVRNDARQGLMTAGGVHVVVAVFAFLVAAMA